MLSARVPPWAGRRAHPRWLAAQRRQHDQVHEPLRCMAVRDVERGAGKGRDPVRVEVARLHPGCERLGRLEHGPGDAGPEVEVEPALALVRVRVRGEEGHGPPEERELEHRARVVGDHEVGDEHQLVHVRPVRDVDGKPGHGRGDDGPLPHERVEAQQHAPLPRQRTVHRRQVQVVVVASGMHRCRRGTSARTGGPCRPVRQRVPRSGLRRPPLAAARRRRTGRCAGTRRRS